LKRERFRHERNDVWLRDCLAFLDRKRRILIGKFAKLIGQEGLAGNRAHGIQDQFGSYAPSENGLFDHFITKASEILFFEMQIHRVGPRSSCHDATE